MSTRTAPLLLVAAIVAAGMIAVFRPDAPATDTTPTSATATATPAPEPMRADPQGTGDPHGGMGALPPDHPPVGTGAAADPFANAAPATDDAPGLAWTAPPAWGVAPNPNTMRLATYKVPGAGGDAELSVTRAGGSADANITRWVGQFDGAGKDVRTERSVKGMKVTLVEVSGTYLGGMAGAPSNASHPGWSLLAAIVGTTGDSYFFKMTGPTATVKAARPAFDAMIDGLVPK